MLQCYSMTSRSTLTPRPQFFSRSSFIFISSSSVLGTLTNAGTVTALSFRKACESVNHMRARPDHGAIPYQERRPPADGTKRPPRNITTRPDHPPHQRKRARDPPGSTTTTLAWGRGITYIADGPLGQLPVPLVLDAVDLTVGGDVYGHDRVHDLLLLDALDDVLVGHLELDGVARVGHAVVLQLDGLEDCGQAVPLGRVLGVARSHRDGIGEGGRRVPQAEVLEGRVAFEELFWWVSVDADWKSPEPCRKCAAWVSSRHRHVHPARSRPGPSAAPSTPRLGRS